MSEIVVRTNLMTKWVDKLSCRSPMWKQGPGFRNTNENIAS